MFRMSVPGLSDGSGHRSLRLSIPILVPSIEYGTYDELKCSLAVDSCSPSRAGRRGGAPLLRERFYSARPTSVGTRMSYHHAHVLRTCLTAGNRSSTSKMTSDLDDGYIRNDEVGESETGYDAISNGLQLSVVDWTRPAAQTATTAR